MICHSHPSSAPIFSDVQPLPSPPMDLISFYCSNDMASIHMLPPELLFDIFAFCTENEGLAPLKLRQVCRRWQDTTDTSPLLWRTLTLTDSRDNILTAQQVELWSRNAEPFKYDIQLNLILQEYVLPIMAPLLPVVDRWRSLTFRERHDEMVMVEPLSIRPEMLTHLLLNMYDYEFDTWEDEPDDPRVSFSPIEGTSEYALNITLAFLPASCELLPRLHFTHISLVEGGQNANNASSTDILELLMACPELESFFLTGYPHDEPCPTQCPIVRLPNLVTLHLKNTCFVRVILSHIDAPCLENLILSHINVAFPLQAATYASEGDSDDEANDFSQSPSSDKATGIGLRKLIKRCSPPLRMLDMDFSDMRTKDFQYVFDRLPYLEDFRIVASDMSDKVVNLLRPVRPSDGKSPSYVRLPHLRKLGLMNCLRMTGDAVLQTVKERVEWTDSHTPEWTLVDVDVTSCPGVGPDHRVELSRILTSRLRDGI